MGFGYTPGYMAGSAVNNLYNFPSQFGQGLYSGLFNNQSNGLFQQPPDNSKAGYIGGAPLNQSLAQGILGTYSNTPQLGVNGSNIGTTENNTAQGIAGGKSNAQEDGLGWGAGLFGAGMGALNWYLNRDAGKQNEKRRREQEIETGLARADIERSRLENMRPEEIQQVKAMELEKAKDESISAASTVAAGNVANSGLGGDVNSAVIAGIKAAAPTLQAAAPYAQAKANTLTEMERAIEQKNQMLESNNRGRMADAYNYTDYIYGQPKAANTLIANLFKGREDTQGAYHQMFGSKG